MGRAYRVARIAGIDIEIHPSWLLILGFVAWSLSDAFFPDHYESWSTFAYWAVGISSAVLLFVTVLIHEMAHALVARHRGLPVPRITLFIFGGMSHMSRQPATAGEEFQIAAAGPATSILIALVSAGLGFAFREMSEKAEAILFYLAFVNLALGIFNILPGFPLDGGRVLRSIAWKRSGSFRQATRVASSVGEMFGYGLIVAGFFILLAGGLLDGLWLAFIGWFLLGAARGEAANLQLEGVLRRLTARDVMQAEFPSVTPGTPVSEIVHDYMVGKGERAVMVANDGAVLGVITVSDVRRVPRDSWAQVPAQRIMTPRSNVITVNASQPAVEVLVLLGEKGLNQVPVLEDGRMVGLVTRRELMDRIQLAERLDPVGEEPPAA
ncbi:MAG TPA: site-2 protease family protein [Tepidiformaceae bacterium]|nr:site-2 protease family protein [Tepidiformaceae bacterium]